MLVTGAAGFIGSHLTDALVDSGAVVSVLVRPRSMRSLGHSGHQTDHIDVYYADLQDHHAVVGVLENFGTQEPVTIFHLAAQAHVGESWDRPYQTIADNVLGTLNLLQACVDARLNVEKLVSAGTSEEYGNIDPERIDQYEFRDGALILNEKSPLNPTSVYGVSKVASDFLTKSYQAAYELNGVSVRSFNNYGPRQNPRYITGTVITQALARPTIELGYLLAKRDMCFCKDGVSGYLSVGERGVPGETYVFGHGENISMAGWADLIIKIGSEMGVWPDDRRVISGEGRGRLGTSEVNELLVDASKLRALAGFKPSYSWEQGLEETISWYAQNRDLWHDNIDWR